MEQELEQLRQQFYQHQHTNVDQTLPISIFNIVNFPSTPSNGDTVVFSSSLNKWITQSGGSGSVTSVSVVSANGFSGTVATATTTPAITLSTTITGLLKGNGTAISAAASGTDYAPATSGTSILYGNGSGGFSNVTVSTGLSFIAGTLSATSTSGTPYSVNADESSATAFTTQINGPNIQIASNTTNNAWTFIAQAGNVVFQPIGANGWECSNAGLANAIGNMRMGFVAPSASNPTSGFSADTPNTVRLRFYGQTRSTTPSATNRIAIGFSDLTGGSDFYKEVSTDGRDVKFVFDCDNNVHTPTTYAVCSNSTAVTTTNLNVDPNTYHIYEIVLIPQTSAKFYIDGVLKTTITTNLYASGGQIMFLEIGTFNATNPSDIEMFIQSPTLSITV